MTADLDHHTTTWVSIGNIAKVLCDSVAHGTNEKPHNRWRGRGVNETVGRRFDIDQFTIGRETVQCKRTVASSLTKRGTANERAD